MYSLRVQPSGSKQAKEGRNAVCTSQTHPRSGTAPITGTLRRPRRIYPRSYRPKPPETSKTQADGTRRRVKGGTASVCPTKHAPYLSPTYKTKRLFQHNRLNAVIRVFFSDDRFVAFSSHCGPSIGNFGHGRLLSPAPDVRLKLAKECCAGRSQWVAATHALKRSAGVS